MVLSSGGRKHFKPFNRFIGKFDNSPHDASAKDIKGNEVVCKELARRSWRKQSKIAQDLTDLIQPRTVALLPKVIMLFAKDLMPTSLMLTAKLSAPFADGEAFS